MQDWLPLRAWLLITVAVLGFMPARYVLRHVWDHPAGRDITKPPEDFGWRSSKQLLVSLAVLTALGAFSIFIFTPTATQVGHSAHFWPALSAGMGVWMIWTVGRGFTTDSIVPMTRGSLGPYNRRLQPKRFWSSVAWNGVWGCGFVWLAIVTNFDASRQELTTQCYNSDDSVTLDNQVSACSKLMRNSKDQHSRTIAYVLASRGTAYHRQHKWDQAFADYSRAIALNPASADTHFNRALVSLYHYDLKPALVDLNAAINARPDWIDAYEQRAWTYEHLGDDKHAAEDRSKMHELRQKDQAEGG